jgi:hypothetical protein
LVEVVAGVVVVGTDVAGADVPGADVDVVFGALYCLQSLTT